MNNPVNFELAKLLKEKEFELSKERPKYYFSKNLNTGSYLYDIDGELKLIGMPDVAIKNGYIDAPTIAEVVMWLYERYDIWINVQMSFKEFDLCIQTDWNYKSEKQINDVLEFMCSSQFVKPTEAYEAAIEYTLKNLI